MIRKPLLNLALHLRNLRGGWRIVTGARNLCYAPFRRRNPDGLLYELDLYEWTQLELATGRYTEPQTIELIRSLLRAGDSVVDVGAHVGSLGLVCRQCVGDAGRIVSIEPQPYNCERLLRNWELNGFTNHVLYVAAAGAEAGNVTLPQQAATDKARLSLALPMPDATRLNFVVPVTTVDLVAAAEKLKRIALLKIDVEGFELEVLKGAAGTIQRVDNVIFETLPAAESAASNGLAASGSEVAAWLKSHGFEVCTIDGLPWNGQLPVPEANLWARRSSGA